MTSDEAHKQQRVKARWAILRRALLDSAANESAATDDDKNDTYSMNSFPGFGVLNRAVVVNESKYQSHATDEDGEWQMIQNSYTTNKHTIKFYTREVKKKSVQIKRDALLSHRKYGVDNTGNVRVWDAESTLAGFLLDTIFEEGNNDIAEDHRICATHEERPSHGNILSSIKESLRFVLLKNSSSGKALCNVLELGAGQAGLAGLGLVAATCSSGSTTLAPMKQLHLTLTDGHPNCVKSNTVCAQIMSQTYLDKTFTIDTRLLLWDSSRNGLDSCKDVQESIDLCLASDCVHFQEYHDGLFMTCARTLAVGGFALLCQPKRGSSLDNFMKLVNEVNNGLDDRSNPLFEVILLEDFHPKVSQMHKAFTQNQDADASSYNPNWHQPLLLCLKKLRSYNEEFDGKLARDHIPSRNSSKEPEVPQFESNRLAPYNPTHVTAQIKALEMLNLQSNDILFDLGCGDGRLLVTALQTALENQSELRCVGIEYDQTLSETAKANIQEVFARTGCNASSKRAYIRWDDVLNEKKRGNVSTAGADAEQLTLLNDATAVFVYLLPDGLRKVKPLLVEAAKRRRTQRETDKHFPPFRVVSYMFSIPGWKAVAVDTSSKSGCALNYYEDIDFLDSA